MPCTPLCINNDGEAITRFTFCYHGQEDEEDTPTELFAYDYDTIEGIDHIISELDLENKTDENSQNFLLLLQNRRHYFHYHSEEGKKEREERRKELENIKFLEGFVSLADVIESVEKEIMNLESEFDEYVERAVRISRIHEGTEIEGNIKSWEIFSEWWDNGGSSFIAEESDLEVGWNNNSWFKVEDTANPLTGRMKKLRDWYFQRIALLYKTSRVRLVKTSAETTDILPNEGSSWEWPPSIEKLSKNYIKEIKESKEIIDKIDEIFVVRDESLLLAQRIDKLIYDVFCEVKKCFYSGLDADGKINARFAKVKSGMEHRGRDKIKRKEKVLEILWDASPKKLNSIKEEKNIYLQQIVDSFSLSVNEILYEVYYQQGWDHYKEHLQSLQTQNQDYYRTWEQVGLKSYNEQIQLQAQLEIITAYGDRTEQVKKPSYLPALDNIIGSDWRKQIRSLTDIDQVRTKKNEFLALIAKAEIVFIPQPEKPTPKEEPPVKEPPKETPPQEGSIIIKEKQVQVKNQITNLLKNHNLKTSDLPAKYQNWETKISQMKTISEINNYLQELEKAITQNAQSQTIQPTNNFTTRWKLVIGVGVILLLVEIVYVYYLWVRKGMRGKRSSQNKQ